MLTLLRALFSRPTETASVSEASSLMLSGAVLVDVREPSEWLAGHAKGAVHVPLAELQRHGRGALTSRGITAGAGSTVLLICRSGMRSGMACQKLKTEDAFRVINVKGGTLAWQRAGLPMEDAR